MCCQRDNTNKAGPLLTDSQLREWKDRVHQKEMEVVRLNSIIARKNRRLRRYIRRHYGMNYGERTEKGKRKE